MVDASVLVDALLDDGVSGDDARAALVADPVWAAPPYLLVEVLSVTRRRLLRQQVTVGRAAEVVAALIESDVTWLHPGTLVARTFELRDNLSAFDAGYVAAAELLGCALVTADRRLAAASGPRCEIRVLQRP